MPSIDVVVACRCIAASVQRAPPNKRLELALHALLRLPSFRGKCVAFILWANFKLIALVQLRRSFLTAQLMR